MKNKLIGSLVLLLSVVTLALADKQLVLGSLVFYPPEIIIFGWLAAIVVIPGGAKRLIVGFLAWPLYFRWSVAVILATGTMGMIISPIFPHSLGAYKSWIISPLVLVLLLTTLKTKWKSWVYGIIVMFGLVVALGTLVGFNPALPGLRLSAWYLSPNIVSSLLGGICATVYVLWRTKKIPALLGAPVTAVIFLALLLTQSAGAILAFSVTWLVYELSRKKDRSKLFVVAVITLILGVSIVGSRLITKDNSFDSRVQIWHSAATMIELSPVAGVGLRGFEYRYTSVLGSLYRDPIDWAAPHPHNLFMSWWLGLGIFGLIAFLYLLWNVWLTKKFQEPAWWGLLVVLIHGLIDTPYWRVDMVILFWLYMTIILLKDGEYESTTVEI